MASTAATGSIPEKDVAETLAASSSALTMNSSTVAAPMVTSPLETVNRELASSACCRSTGSATVNCSSPSV